MTLGGVETFQNPPRRWADMSMDSTSEDDITKSGAPVIEDSYRGRPLSCMEASNDGIMAKLVLNDGPKDFAAVVTQRNGNIFVEDEVRKANAMERSHTSPVGDLSAVQDMDDWDGDDDVTNPSGSSRRFTSQSDVSGAGCSSAKPKGKAGKSGKGKEKKGKGKSKIEINEARPFEHQVCFEWSRKIAGCTDPCPNGRKHACEHCGSCSHRGIEHDDAVGIVNDSQDQKMDRSDDKGGVQLPILEVEDNPIDFGFLLRGACPKWSPSKISSTMNSPQVQEFDDEDAENEDSNSKRARMWNSQPRKTGQLPVSFELVKEKQSAADKEKLGFAHQRCFEWSRKPDGCSHPCPKNRLHVCEFCGSPDHRGLHHTGDKLAPCQINVNGKRTRLDKKTKIHGSGGLNKGTSVQG